MVPAVFDQPIGRQQLFGDDRRVVPAARRQEGVQRFKEVLLLDEDGSEDAVHLLREAVSGGGGVDCVQPLGFIRMEGQAGFSSRAVSSQPARQLVCRERNIPFAPCQARFEIEADQGVFRTERQQRPAGIETVVEVTARSEALGHERLRFRLQPGEQRERIGGCRQQNFADDRISQRLFRILFRGLSGDPAERPQIGGAPAGHSGDHITERLRPRRFFVGPQTQPGETDRVGESLAGGFAQPGVVPERLLRGPVQLQIAEHIEHPGRPVMPELRRQG